MIKVYQNFLPQEQFDVYKTIILSNEFPWYFIDHVAYKEDTQNFLFFHLLLNEENVKSPFYKQLVDPLIKQINYKPFRIKANLYTKKELESPSGFHVDAAKPHKVALYSVNTCNGYTLFENGDKVPSIENSLTVFDGSMSHASVPQTDEKVRVNVNINLE
tara:strand:- start:624 stop:1103 length:480 start_codon:yes stop_codon:yes gene_type:complete